MNDTPRLRSAFPTTPRTGTGNGLRFGSPISPTHRGDSKSPSFSTLNRKDSLPAEPANEPLIPLDTIDAATQRLIVFSLYALLWAYRIYDFYALVSDTSTESLWLFMKWVCFDGVFLFGLPALRIPWLEYSAPAVTVLFLIHVLVNGMLMFRVGLPLTLWLEALARMLYNREISISEHKVKASDVLDSSSLISGKQVISILPEGSAFLNPNRDAFCLGGSIHQVELPIQINQTRPILIELIRVDLATGDRDVVTISSKQLKASRKNALGKQFPRDSDSPLLLHHAVKKTGHYTLRKIVDESKLEVRPRHSEAVVVQCPQARILRTSADKCRGELSDIAIEVIGTPPLKVKYRKMVNDNPVEASFQSIQPDDFLSPLSRTQQVSRTLVDLSEIDVSWAKTCRVVVPVNETMSTTGQWWYAIDEVQDALGNSQSYAAELDDYDIPGSKAKDQQQLLVVHERPRISLRSSADRPPGCDSQHPLKVAKGVSTKLPVKFHSDRKGEMTDIAHTVEYLFTPQDDLLSAGEHNPERQELRKHVFKTPRDSLLLSQSGLYSLASVATQYCSGEVMEPSSCLMQNPPEPEVQIQATNITDKCAGNPIGLTITMDFVGTPPFKVGYVIQKKGASAQHRLFQTNSQRDQFVLTPQDAGHYSYSFNTVDDKYYVARKVDHKLEQIVKPSASAHFETASPSASLCLHENYAFDVKLGGDGPWNLEWELLHNGRRKKEQKKGITSEHFTIDTGILESGGDYILAITSVEAGGCKQYSKEEVSFSVRQQRPKVAFGVIEGKRHAHTLEGKRLRLPIRLSGEKPWTIQYINMDEETHQVKQPHQVKQRITYDENFLLETQESGTFLLQSVRDSACPGVVEDGADQFKIEWIPRPTLRIANSDSVELASGKYVKEDVCEGDEDSVELTFTGNPPFDVKYEEHAAPDQGPKSLRRKMLNAALGTASIQLETMKAGMYEYRFTKLSDGNYDYESKHFTPIALNQRVNPRPAARFAHPGKTYSFCSVQDSGEDGIPIVLTGVPPFHLEVEIRNSGTAKPEMLSIPNIGTTNHPLRIPHKYLYQGHSHISIQQVRDSRGCQSKLDPTEHSPRVHITVHDPPKIIALEATTDYCVGDYLNFRLSGAPPFTIYYTFKDKERKATASSTQFRRIADEPGTFTINSISDSDSECRAVIPIEKTIHAKPRGTLSKGRISFVDIHEGGETELQFDFDGTPPFEFTYIRSENEKGGKPGRVLETKTEKTNSFSVVRSVSIEGSYELVSVKDAWCLSSKMKAVQGDAKKGQKLLMS